MAAICVVHRCAVDCAYLGHSVLNLNKRTYRVCSCGSADTEEHLLLICTLHSALRVDLMQSVKSIYWKVCKIYCQVCHTIIQNCCNFYCLDIFRLNISPQLTYIMLSLNIFNVLTLRRHNTLDFSIIATSYHSVPRIICSMLAVYQSVYSCLQSFVNCLSFVSNPSLTVRRELVRSTWRDEKYIQAPACRSSSLNKHDFNDEVENTPKLTFEISIAQHYSYCIAAQTGFSQNVVTARQC